MEAWRPESEDAEKRRPVVSGRTLAVSLAVHVAAFLAFFLYSVVHGLFKDDEVVIPIDLTIVVNENLDGKEDEPPPLDDPPPPPPPQPKKPKPKPVVKKPDPPKALEQIVTNIVAKVDKQEEKKEEKKPEPKKEEPKKPEEPKKTAKELREERIREMRNKAKNTNKKPVPIKVPNQPSGDGRTDKKIMSDAEIMARLNAGYKPGKSNQLAASDEQLAISLIKQAFEAKWDAPARTDSMKPMTMRVWFGSGGRVIRTQLVGSSGDARADQSIKVAAQRVGTVRGLPSSFIEACGNDGVDIVFKVK